MIEVIHNFILFGFDRQQIFGLTSFIPLKIAYDRGLTEVLNFLLSEEVVNHWNLPLDFMLFARYLMKVNDLEALTTLFTSCLGANAFNLGLPTTADRATFV